MSLLQQIKKDQIHARKEEPWNAPLLTTLLSEAAMVGKNDGNRESTDEEVIAIVKKFIKGSEELMNAVKDPECIPYQTAREEIKILSQYLPVQMTEEEIREAVQLCIATLDELSPQLMGKIMGWLKEKYEGRYDGKLASKIVKELLNG